MNRRTRSSVTTFYPTGPKPRRRVFDELDLIGFSMLALMVAVFAIAANWHRLSTFFGGA